MLTLIYGIFNKYIKPWRWYWKDGIYIAKHDVVYLWPWQREKNDGKIFDPNIIKVFKDWEDYWDFWDSYSATYLNTLRDVVEFLFRSDVNDVRRYGMADKELLLFAIHKRVKYRDRIIGTLKHLDRRKFKTDVFTFDNVNVYLIQEATMMGSDESSISYDVEKVED